MLTLRSQPLAPARAALVSRSSQCPILVSVSKNFQHSFVQSHLPGNLLPFCRRTSLHGRRHNSHRGLATNANDSVQKDNGKDPAALNETMVHIHHRDMDGFDSVPVLSLIASIAMFSAGIGYMLAIAKNEDKEAAILEDVRRFAHEIGLKYGGEARGSWSTEREKLRGFVEDARRFERDTELRYCKIRRQPHQHSPLASANRKSKEAVIF